MPKVLGKSVQTLVPIIPQKELGTAATTVDGEMKNYAWLSYGEIMIGGRVYRHGEVVQLEEDDPAAPHLICLDPEPDLIAPPEPAE